MSIDSKAFYKLSYGLFLLTSQNQYKDNGCIINTAAQLTSNPQRISVTVNKNNYTHDMIAESGIFNVCVLTQNTPFDFFRNFGFQSGKMSDKFRDFPELRSKNGLMYCDNYANALISGKVISKVDCGTHTLFIADVPEAYVLSDIPSVTYDYYFKNIKPKPEASEKKKKGYVCKICGYVYEGEQLPEDFVCPICKHGAADFERIE
jgi:flavin reductase (DIM6/NTAB) family NADH-FMN oxidoreductase RutF